MIIYTSKDSFLEIPKGLGNLGGNSGGGSGEDLGPLSGSVVELSAVTESEAVKLADLSASTENLASSVGSMATDLEAVSGSVETLSETVDSQGDSIADLLLDVDALDGRVSANTEAVQALSGVTGDVASLSAQTSANTAQIEALSAATEDLSATTEDIYNEVFYEEEGERYSYIGDLQDAMDEKQDVLEAGSGISLDSSTISVNAGKGLYFKEDGKMEVLLGDGLQYSGSRNALSVKIGDGLAFSGDTLVASGGSSSGPQVYILNLMTQQERLALYTELAAYRDAPTYTGVQSGFPAQDYAFYYWAGQDNSDEFNDRFRGFVPMQLAAIHPDDYGGACFFTGVVYGRQGGGTVVMVRYIIASDGSFDMSRGMNEYNPHPEIAIMHINSGGTFESELWELGNLSNTDITYRLWIRYDDGNGNVSQSPMQDYRKAYEEISPDNWRDVYYFSALIPIGNTTYKGQWRIVQTYDWEGDGPYPATSWVAQ